MMLRCLLTNCSRWKKRARASGPKYRSRIRGALGRWDADMHSGSSSYSLHGSCAGSASGSTTLPNSSSSFSCFISITVSSARSTSVFSVRGAWSGASSSSAAIATASASSAAPPSTSRGPSAAVPVRTKRSWSSAFVATARPAIAVGCSDCYKFPSSGPSPQDQTAAGRPIPLLQGQQGDARQGSRR